MARERGDVVAAQVAGVRQVGREGLFRQMSATGVIRPSGIRLPQAVEPGGQWRKRAEKT